MGTYFISNCFLALLALFGSVGYTVVGLRSAHPISKGSDSLLQSP
jgi:hypothetical protein